MYLLRSTLNSALLMATTISNSDLTQLNAALVALSKIQLPVRAAFCIARSSAETARAMEALNTVRMDIIKRHAELDDTGEPKVADDEYIMTDRAAFNADYEELLKQETTVELFTIAEDALDGVSLAPAILVPLLGHVIAGAVTEPQVPATKPAKRVRNK